jgi:hypothetical protein
MCQARDVRIRSVLRMAEPFEPDAQQTGDRAATARRRHDGLAER